MYTYLLKNMTVLSWVNFYLKSVKFLFFFAKYSMSQYYCCHIVYLARNSEVKIPIWSKIEIIKDIVMVVIAIWKNEEDPIINQGAS